MVNGWLAQKCNGTAPQNGKTQRQTMLQNPLQDQAKRSNSDLTGAGILLIFLFILLFLFPYWMLLEPFPLINYSLRNPCLRLCFGEAMRDKSQITQHLDDASQHERDWEALAWRSFCLFIMVHIYILLKKKKKLIGLRCQVHSNEGRAICHVPQRGCWALPDPFVHFPALKLLERKKV